MKKLYLSKGKGKGKTKMLAYCKALEEAGIANMNIIRLSSVIPHNSQIINEKPPIKFQDYGKKLYAVLSEIRIDSPGEIACAGIGYSLNKKKTGQGLMVEITGNDEKKVKEDIIHTLKDFLDEKEYDLENILVHTKSVKCEDEPVCALVAMSFEIEDWNEL